MLRLIKPKYLEYMLFGANAVVQLTLQDYLTKRLLNKKEDRTTEENKEKEEMRINKPS